VERKLLWLTWRELKNDGDASLQRIGFAIASLFAQELRDSDHINSSDGVNHGKRLLTEIVGLHVFLTHVLSVMSRGEWLDDEQYEEGAWSAWDSFLLNRVIF
jgi:hypothetical protein